MLARTNPREAYRRIDFDARVAGASPGQLVTLCYEQLLGALGSALHGAATGDSALTSRALTRAVAALTALQLGVDRAAPAAPALLRFYAAARRLLLDSVPAFDAPAVATLRADCTEIAAALAGAGGEVAR